MSKIYSISSILLLLVLVAAIVATDARYFEKRVKRAAGDGKHHIAIHSHMSRKILDRACAATKDVIDEIILCVTNNKVIMENVKENRAQDCHKEAFGVEFDKNDLKKHHEEICKQKDKFEVMIGCVYEKISAESTAEEMEKVTESMVDVGLCVINALD